MDYGQEVGLWKAVGELEGNILWLEKEITRVRWRGRIWLVLVVAIISWRVYANSTPLAEADATQVQETCFRL